MADVAIVGAGPAGALAARQLAVFGLDVELVRGPRRNRQHLGESLSASAPRLLGSYGLEIPESVYAPRPNDHFVRWGGREDRIAAQPEAGGGEGQRLVRRDRLDDWAVSEARAAGARVVEGSATRDPGTGRAALVIRRQGEKDRRVTARALIDASGRSGALTREGRERPDFRTTALTAHFAPGGREGTVIEAFSDGWVWSAPVVGGRRDVTVMLDTEGAGTPEERYRQALDRADLAGFVTGSPLTPIRAADVTPYRLGCADRAGDPPLIAVGDAASALDPLSGLGAMKAMDSGLTAAVVLRTALARPPDARLAQAFHATKERGLAVEAEERVAGFYAEEERFAGREFWRRRSRRPAAPAPRRRLPGDGRLAPAPGARIEAQGVLKGDWIVRAEVVVRPGRVRPAHKIAGVTLADLFRTAAATGSIRRTIDAVPAPEPAVRAALSWLVGEEFLIDGGAKPASAAGAT
ncbi:MAG: tryptophan 7-halogenase [Acidobacteriota bacterium]|nr:tryptophan 7-halogenase [Acidobacteriota bacterium]